MEKILTVDGHDIPFKASGATPRIYRKLFRADIFGDMDKLLNRDSSKNFTTEELAIFENIAYTMAYQGDPDIVKDPDLWLDQFEIFSIYQILPDLVDLWHLNEEQIEQAKKNLEGQSGN